MNENNTINTFRKKWILNNIIENNNYISFYDISLNLGLVGSEIVELLTEMKKEKLIIINTDSMRVEITFEGRVMLNSFLYKNSISINDCDILSSANANDFEDHSGTITKYFINSIRSNECTY